MPLYKSISPSSHTKLYFWKTTEDYTALFKAVSLKDSSLARVEAMKSESHQKGFLSVRMLLQHAGYSDYDLDYDQFGKPHLKDQHFISISHSYEFSAIAISDKFIGIDIEKTKDKILKIASRFMDVSHLENLSREDQIQKATVVWGIKESIFKIKNEQGISFPNHIFEDDFSIDDKKARATLKFNDNIEEVYNILFDSIEDYIYVCAFEELAEE